MDVIDQLNKVATEINAKFSGLSEEQINWKPEESSWSIGQCLDHLLVSNNTYFPIFDKLLSQEYQLPLVQRFNPFKRSLGPMMIKSLGPESDKKFRNPDIFQPSLSAIPKDIISRFAQHQQVLKDYINRLQQLDMKRLVITSPVTIMISYSLEDALQIIAAHEQRHLNQALHVLNHPNFPG